MVYFFVDIFSYEQYAIVISKTIRGATEAKPSVGFYYWMDQTRRKAYMPQRIVVRGTV